MKRTSILVTALMAVIYCTGSPAGTLPDSVSRDSLISPPPIESFSFGLNYDEGQRKISNNSTTIARLDSRSYSFLLGYDVSKWCTVFATLGSSQARLSEGRDFGDGKFKWSLGINANLWHTEIEEPSLFTGRISLKPALEIAQYNSNMGSETIKWSDISGALLLAYEKVMEDPHYNLTEFFGYSVYAGPAFSRINGSVNSDSDFQESRSFGLIGGLDLFITHNFSIGGQIQSFDEVSFGGNVRYHF